MSHEEILIDGTILEGGGQILRTSLSCSSIFKIPITIENIRGKRPKPGLQNQHLTGVQLIEDICKASISGDSLQSVSLKFRPNCITSGVYDADSKTAGSVCLIIQSTLPTLLYGNAKSCLSLIGGTDAEFAPPIDFYKYVVQYYLEKMSIQFTVDVIRRGFFPKGGGKVVLEIEPVKDYINVINLMDQGSIIQIRGFCFVAGSLPIDKAKDMGYHLVKNIKKHSNYRNLDIQVESVKYDINKAFGNGSGCLLLVDTTTGCRFGFNIVGKRGLSEEDMGVDVANQFVKFFDSSRGCLDTQMQDQILLFMALAKGLSTIRCSELTLHSKTCMYIIEKMTTAKFVIEPVNKSTDVVVSCEGLGVLVKDLNM